MPHGLAAGRRSMVHGGPWIKAWPEFTRVRACQHCSDPELVAATPKLRGGLNHPH
jgi:hypothetical protein